VTETGGSTYTFDANGNQMIVQHPADSKWTTWTWDYENQMRCTHHYTRIGLPNRFLVTIIYNAENRRLTGGHK
jgi:hypothetical protein